MPSSEDSVLWPADQQSRNLAYSPSSCVDDIAPFLQRYAAESERVRAMHPPRTERYGPGPNAELDVFEAGTDRVHCFIHGGYWQQLDKSDASFPAEQFLETGVTYIAVGYDLCPQVALPEIVGQAREAIRWVKAAYPGAEVAVSGSSAGAHLAAMASVYEPVDRLVLLSGVYDLRPLVTTYVNDLVAMDSETAAHLSPLLHAAPITDATVVWGENETDAFKRQSQLFATHLGVDPGEIAGRNHFDIVHDVYDISERV